MKIAPSELILRAIGMAIFPPCDFAELTRASSACPSPLLAPIECLRYGAGYQSVRIPLETAVRGDGIRYALADGVFWGILARVGASSVYCLTPSENGVALLKIESVRIKEVHRYV